jgi:hypothetical protein
MRMKLVGFVGALALAVATLPVQAQVVEPEATQPPAVIVTDPVIVPVNQFVISGLVGGNFGSSVEEGSLNFGGAFDYLRNGQFGFQFLADFNPNANLQRNLPGDTKLNSYMFNAIAAAPMGIDGRWQPYISGGVGLLTLNQDAGDEFEEVFATDNEQFGANVGVGLMAFQDWIGFRADVRYYTGLGDDADDVTPELSLANLGYWRGNVGLSFRF